MCRKSLPMYISCSSFRVSSLQLRSLIIWNLFLSRVRDTDLVSFFYMLTSSFPRTIWRQYFPLLLFKSVPGTVNNPWTFAETKLSNSLGPCTQGVCNGREMEHLLGILCFEADVNSVPRWGFREAIRLDQETLPSLMAQTTDRFNIWTVYWEVGKLWTMEPRMKEVGYLGMFSWHSTRSPVSAWCRLRFLPTRR